MLTTHGQFVSCEAKTTKVDDGVEDIRWIRCLGREGLPAALYAVLPNPEKKSGHRRGIGNFALHARRQTYFVPDA